MVTAVSASACVSASAPASLAYPVVVQVSQQKKKTQQQQHHHHYHHDVLLRIVSRPQCRPLTVVCNSSATAAAAVATSSSICKPITALQISSAAPCFLWGGQAGVEHYLRKNKRDSSSLCVVAATKKPDSASKRGRQAVKRRMINRSRKSELRTRMKKALEALVKLKKTTSPEPDAILPIEKLIAEAYSAIDKAVKIGSIHRNTGARRKSRLARNKRAVVIHHGWYSPAATA